MPKMFKLVTQDYVTHGGMKWKIGQTNKATQKGTEMCTPQVLHCYSDPRLAVLFNPCHADITNPILLEICASEIVATDGLKSASKEQTPTCVLPLPTITITQKVAFAIKCALLAYKATGFVLWAEKWLDGTDRSDSAASYAASDAARAASGAARAASGAASYAASYAASDAARAASDAASYAASYAASDAARAASYAASAARAASDAASYAARAARAASAASDAAMGITFIEIISDVMDNF